MNWMLITARLSLTHTGDHPPALTWIVSASTPIIFGMLGPHTSASMIPTVRVCSPSSISWSPSSSSAPAPLEADAVEASACASSDVKVLLPTPPLPLSTRTLWRTPARRAEMTGISGSGPLLGADAQIAWFGHPAHESALPARSDSGPGQCSGSGATNSGRAFSGCEITSCTASGSSSRDGAISPFSSLYLFLDLYSSCAGREKNWNA